MKNENLNLDILLRKALNSSDKPAPALIDRVKNQNFKEEQILRKPALRRSFGMAVAACMAFVILTTTAFAAWYFLRPGDVAERFEDNRLAAAFNSETAVNINKSVTSGDYIFTLLAAVSGEDLTDHPTFFNDDIRNDRTYAVVAVQHKDGSPMPRTQDDEYGNVSFYVSPYIKGLKPWQVNAHTMNGGYSETVVDGVMYRIVDCDEVTMFADRGIYLGINTGSFYNSEAFIYDEEAGIFEANPAFDGVSILFDLPIDKSLANPEKAQQYLDELFAEPEVDGDGLDRDGEKADAGTKRVLTYDEYKAWTEQKLAEAQALVDKGEYPKNTVLLLRRVYEDYLKELEDGGVMTLTEYSDGSYETDITYPNDGYAIVIDNDGGLVIKD